MTDEASIEFVPTESRLSPLDMLQIPTSESRIRVRQRQERVAKWKAKGQVARAIHWRRRDS